MTHAQKIDKLDFDAGCFDYVFCAVVDHDDQVAIARRDDCGRPAGDPVAIKSYDEIVAVLRDAVAAGRDADATIKSLIESA